MTPQNSSFYASSFRKRKKQKITKRTIKRGDINKCSRRHVKAILHLTRHNEERNISYIALFLHRICTIIFSSVFFKCVIVLKINSKRKQKRNAKNRNMEHKGTQSLVLNLSSSRRGDDCFCNKWALQF